MKEDRNNGRNKIKEEKDGRMEGMKEDRKTGRKGSNEGGYA
jgi:hypothetical protein